MNNSQIRPIASDRRKHHDQYFDSAASANHSQHPPIEKINNGNGKSYRGTQLELQFDNLQPAPKYPLIDVPAGRSIQQESTADRKFRLVKLIGSSLIGLGLLAGLGYLMLRGANALAKPDRSCAQGISPVTVANVTQKNRTTTVTSER